jgi:hypothetical protein
MRIDEENEKNKKNNNMEEKAEMTIEENIRKHNKTTHNKNLYIMLFICRCVLSLTMVI